MTSVDEIPARVSMKKNRSRGESVSFCVQFGRLKDSQVLPFMRDGQKELHESRHETAAPFGAFHPIAELNGDVGSDDSDGGEHANAEHDEQVSPRDPYEERRDFRRTADGGGPPDSDGSGDSDGGPRGFRHSSFGKNNRHRRPRPAAEAHDDHDWRAAAFRANKDQHREWSKFWTDKRQLDKASGPVSWSRWKKDIAYARSTWFLTDEQIVLWMAEALTGHALLVWRNESNRFASEVNGPDAARERHAIRDALKFLRNGVYDTDRNTALNFWDSMRFNYRKDAPIGYQCDNFYDKVQAAVDLLPDSYHDSTHVYDKMLQCFSRHAWFLADTERIDPEDPMAPHDIVKKAKRAYRVSRQKEKVASDEADTLFQEMFAQNERRLTPPRNTVPHRHIVHPGRNPLDYSGNVMKCTGCGHIDHLYKQCQNPDKVEYRKRVLEKLERSRGRDRKNRTRTYYMNELSDLSFAVGGAPNAGTPQTDSENIPGPIAPDLSQPGSESDSISVANEGNSDAASGVQNIDEVHWCHDPDQDEIFFLAEAEHRESSRSFASFSLDESVTAVEPDRQLFRLRRH